VRDFRDRATLSLELVRKPHFGLQRRLSAHAFAALGEHAAEGMRASARFGSAQNPAFRSRSRFPDEF
jgi:hypothetical protein